MSKMILGVLIVFISCNQNNGTASQTDSGFSDPVYKQHWKDSALKAIKQDSYDRVFGDTSGVYRSPIKVISFKIVRSESGSYRNVQLTYKNVSDRKVSAIKFRWKGIDAFGEPADLGNNFAEGYGSGFMDNGLKPGKTTTSEWEILSRNARNLTGAWCIEAIYDNDSKWELNP